MENLLIPDEATDQKKLFTPRPRPRPLGPGPGAPGPGPGPGARLLQRFLAAFSTEEVNGTSESPIQSPIQLPAQSPLQICGYIIAGNRHIYFYGQTQQEYFTVGEYLGFGDFTTPRTPRVPAQGRT